MSSRFRYKNIKSFFQNHGLLRSILILVSGAGLAHLITAIALPFLTRLYTPNEFSTLAAFSAVLSTISVAACLRFDIAIPLASRDEEARHLLGFALAATSVMAFVAAVVVFWKGDALAALFGRGLSTAHLWLMPLGIICAGAYAAFQNWFIREKKFWSIAKSRIAQSIASVGTQVTLGILGAGAVGLLTGYIFNTGIGFLILCGIWWYSRGSRPTLHAELPPSPKATWKKYDQFPKFSVVEALANSASTQIPLMIIAASLTGPEAGYLLLGISIIQAPMAVLGSSISQVFISQAPEQYRQGKLNQFVSSMLKNLLKTGGPPLLVLGAVSPFCFGIIFGAGWERAGTLVAWMTPWFILQFVVAPVSSSLHIIGALRLALFVQVLGFLLRTGAVYLCTRFASDWVSEVYALTGALFYLFYLAVTMMAIKKHR
ncbi:lipopolysaccharide biosynthesis protein [Achromobacter xylosoxidans]|uniref:lipopolysaccharide biosynthesis protein n=1 Tax=Alcaligenes xylosoxydans xylosoxydans TaxID=85698 RepID=UPI0009B5F1A4|nr:oligosaccharide flippase family protein [Achromobacter xylosoxidans]